MSIGNWIAENSNSSGAGALTLTGALLTFTRFRDAVPSGGVWYSIEDANGNREAGYGTFDGTDGLARTEVNATLINGVYNGTNPVAINLSGSQVVAVTFNEQAYVDLVANISANTSNISTNASAISVNTSAIALNTTHRGLTDNPHSVTATQAAYDPTNDPTSSETDVQAALVDHGTSIEERVTTASGLISGGLITGSGTTFTVATGTGIISDSYTDPENSAVDSVSWNEQAGITVNAGGLTIGNVSILMNSAGIVVQVAGNPALSLYRDHVYLGFIVQDGGTIAEINNAPSVVKQTATDTYDLLRYKVNISGVDIRPHDTLLSLWLSEGVAFFPGISWYTDNKSPNVHDLLAVGSPTSAITTEDMTQTGTITTSGTVVPDVYNPSGDTLTALGGNDATIHRLYAFGIGASRKVVLLYGQNSYSNAGVAKENLATDDDNTVVPNELEEAYFLGHVCVDGQAADFNDPNKAWIVSSSGSAGGNTSIPTAASNVSYDNAASGLTATNVQAAIDEVDAKVDAIPAQQDIIWGVLDGSTGAVIDSNGMTGNSPSNGQYDITLTSPRDSVNYSIQATGQRDVGNEAVIVYLARNDIAAVTTTTFSLRASDDTGNVSSTFRIFIQVMGG